ncbi:MAG: hypothetical protein DDT19_02869 [Syntrophomonadaceae bacterium]|nr:hypothetical protein [Bacillota bacterium]
MTKAEREKLQNLWAARIVEFRASGQNAAAWCASNNFSTHQLRYWLKRDQKVSSMKPLDWMSLNLSKQGVCDALLVRVGGATVEVRPGFDQKLLGDVVKTLMAQ